MSSHLLKAASSPDTAPTSLAIVATTRRSKKLNLTLTDVNPTVADVNPTVADVNPPIADVNPTSPKVNSTSETPIQTSVPNPKPQLAKKSTVLEDGSFKMISDIKSSRPHSLWEWHVALGHLNYRDVLYMDSKPDSGVAITGNRKQPTCHICLEAKSKRRYSYQAASWMTKPLSRIHVDIVGGGDTLLMNQKSVSSVPSEYFMLITDDATRFCWCYGLPSREHKIIVAKLREWGAHIKNLGFTYPAFLRSDNEFGSKEIQAVLAKWGTTFEPSNPYSPWQDGVGESSNRVVLFKARSLILGSGLPNRFWLEAVLTAVWLANTTPTSIPLYNDPMPAALTDSNTEPTPLETRIPITALTGKDPRHDKILPLGAWVYYYLNGPHAPKHKLAARAAIGRLIHSVSPTNHRVWDPQTDAIITTADITPTDIIERITHDEADTTSLDEKLTAFCAIERLNLTELDEPFVDNYWIRPLKAFKAFAAMTKTSLLPDVPRSFKEAMSSPAAPHWRAACNREISEFISRHLYDLIPIDDVPIGLKPIPGKWVFTKKPTPEGSIRYKARWVIRRNIMNGHESLFADSAAPVVMESTKMILFAAAAHHGWYIAQADAVTAFLNGRLTSPVYMRQPHGYEQGEKGTLVCKLRQVLYGLTPSARIWYNTLSEKLTQIGFRVSTYDPALWIHTTKPKLYVTSHVDDFGITGAEPSAIRWVLDEMKKQFKIKDLGQMQHYLGMDLIHTESGIKLTQSSYIDATLIAHGMQDANPISTPIDTGLTIDDPPNPTIDGHKYRTLTGALQWLASHTRPDIARAASVLATFNSNPTRSAFLAAKRVLQYLKGTKDVGINFPRGDGALPQPTAYTDANWGGSLTPGKRSCTGYVFLIGRSPISWKSRLQTSVALSSNEAEYMAASDVARKAKWLHRLLNDMAIYPQEIDPIPFYIDNRGAKDLIQSLLVNQRSKHIDVRYHYVRDIAKRRIIKVLPIGTKDMAADGFTKPLPYANHITFLDQLGLS
jgi:hypothetical protein